MSNYVRLKATLPDGPCAYPAWAIACGYERGHEWFLRVRSDDTLPDQPEWIFADLRMCRFHIKPVRMNPRTGRLRVVLIGDLLIEDHVDIDPTPRVCFLCMSVSIARSIRAVEASGSAEAPIARHRSPEAKGHVAIGP